MKPTPGATPLAALDAVVFDTETTGLDTRTARILEIGAVSLRSGVPFATLVDPGEPVPPSSSAIHGITDETVAGSPSFAAAWERFLAFSGGRVLIGYSVGYDLAILEREARRARLGWTRPRSLCLRLLSVLADPALPDYSLDTIADWLGVSISGRHRAYGDAAAAAAVYTALLPRLALRGIRTLAEAERACLSLTAELETHHRAGWAEPVAPPVGERSALRAIDPYAYRHRIGDVMAAMPAVIAASATLAEAIAMMTERRISSVFVADDPLPGLGMSAYGILTERDVMRRIAGYGAGALGQLAGEVATRPLVSIRGDAFVYRAIGRMARLGIRHLAVRTEDSRLAGVVSSRDLLRLRGGAAVDLEDAIEEARTAGQLAAAWSLLPAVAGALVAEDIDARQVAGIVSEELGAMTRRSAALAEAAMIERGRGPAPCPYALLVLGSGGRGESLLAADQDNAVVFADDGPDQAHDGWFAEFGERLTATLDEAGIPLCKGGVMARNAEWRGSLPTWRGRISQWMSRSRPRDLLDVDIFFDLRPVAGDVALGRELLDHAFAEARGEPAFTKLLAAQLDDLGSPFTFLGNLRAEEGRIDLKKFGLFPIVSAARTLAIRHGVRASGTPARLEALAALRIGAEADLAALSEAHRLILRLMLAQQSRDLETGLPVSNQVEIFRLAREDAAALKAALRRIQSIPAMVRDLLFPTPPA